MLPPAFCMKSSAGGVCYISVTLTNNENRFCPLFCLGFLALLHLLKTEE